MNKWKDKEKTLWLQVCLTGRAQAAYKQLNPEVRKRSFDNLAKALCQHLKPDSWRELYAAKFQTRRKRKLESWDDFDADFGAVADKAFPTLGAEGRQQLALHLYQTHK